MRFSWIKSAPARTWLLRSFLRFRRKSTVTATSLPSHREEHPATYWLSAGHKRSASACAARDLGSAPDSICLANRKQIEVRSLRPAWFSAASPQILHQAARPTRPGRTLRSHPAVQEQVQVPGQNHKAGQVRDSGGQYTATVTAQTLLRARSSAAMRGSVRGHDLLSKSARADR